MPPPRFGLSDRIDASRLAAEFAATGRVQIPELLAGDGAANLLADLRGREDWIQVVNSGGKVFELDRAARAALSAGDAERLDAAVQAGARSGFQYRYETIRVDDEARDRGSLLDSFAAFLSSGGARDLLRAVTGFSDVDFADAQATAFSPGDFLTAHDDEIAGKGRRAAYVFSLSADWRPEWGGLLLFHEGDGRVSGFGPRFGALNLFAVPQLHSVSMVTPAAPRRRYSVTGWLRTRGGDG